MNLAGLFCRFVDAPEGVQAPGVADIGQALGDDVILVSVNVNCLTNVARVKDGGGSVTDFME